MTLATASYTRSSVAALTTLAMWSAYTLSSVSGMGVSMSDPFSQEIVTHEEQTDTPALLSYAVQYNPAVEAREIFPELRGLTQDESDAYEAALDKLFTPVGISFFS